MSTVLTVVGVVIESIEEIVRYRECVVAMLYSIFAKCSFETIQKYQLKCLISLFFIFLLLKQFNMNGM